VDEFEPLSVTKTSKIERVSLVSTRILNTKFKGDGVKIEARALEEDNKPNKTFTKYIRFKPIKYTTLTKIK
jgi:hypothetical protein